MFPWNIFYLFYFLINLNWKSKEEMTSTASSTTGPAAVENAPPVDQMMEEISAGTEAVRLEQRLDSLKEVDRKIGELMNIVIEVMSSLDKEKPISKAKMEELYKRYELKLDEVQRGIADQLSYMEQVCVGAEHQGSTFHSKQVAELSAKRLQGLSAQLAAVRQRCLGDGGVLEATVKAEGEEEQQPEQMDAS